MSVIGLGGSARAARLHRADYDSDPGPSVSLTQTKCVGICPDAAPRYIIHPNGATSATIRNAGDNYVMGNAYDGWTFDGNSYTGNNWRFGYTYGSPGYDYCGWILLSDLSYQGNTGYAKCPSGDYHIDPTVFIHEANCPSCGHATPVNVGCDSFWEYGNAQPWENASGTNAAREITGNTGHNYQVSWRYISRYSDVVEVTDDHYTDNQTNHVFIWRGCFPSDGSMPAGEGGLWYP